jgi:hypothetical protein
LAVRYFIRSEIYAADDIRRGQSQMILIGRTRHKAGLREFSSRMIDISAAALQAGSAWPAQRPEIKGTSLRPAISSSQILTFDALAPLAALWLFEVPIRTD